jgi:hypothetical protein
MRVRWVTHVAGYGREGMIETQWWWWKWPIEDQRGNGKIILSSGQGQTQNNIQLWHLASGRPPTHVGDHSCVVNNELVMLVLPSTHASGGVHGRHWTRCVMSRREQCVNCCDSRNAVCCGYTINPCYTSCLTKHFLVSQFAECDVSNYADWLVTSTQNSELHRVERESSCLLTSTKHDLAYRTAHELQQRATGAISMGLRIVGCYITLIKNIGPKGAEIGTS